MLWEIQRVDTFSSKLLTFSEPVRLRNVATGFYMALDANGNLKLVADAEDNNCEFFLVPKKAVRQESELIRYNLHV